MNPIFTKDVFDNQPVPTMISNVAVDDSRDRYYDVERRHDYIQERIAYEQQQPRCSFWSKIGKLFKRVAKVVVSVAIAAATFITAMSRLKSARNRKHELEIREKELIFKQLRASAA
jgi:hypothetical protein